MLTYFVIVPILVAVFLYLFHFNKAARIIAITAQAGFLAASFFLFNLTATYGEVITNIGDYEGVLGIYLRADNLSSVFVLLTAFLFLIVAIYSYNEASSRMFWFMLFIWEGSLIGVFLTGDFFNVFVLKEVATIAVTVLIMYYRLKRSLYDGIIYLMINIVIMQFFLFGVGYIYMLAGALDMRLVSQVLAGVDRSLLILPYALIMTFVALKCALIPVYSWLPKAHGTPGAPAGVSAILSGLHIKSGVYLFLRFHEVFGISILEPSALFFAIGIVTAIIGIVMSISQVDIKLVLAYSTVAQVGFIILGLNIGNYYSHAGSLYHIINHAIFKTALFLIAGIVSHAYHTRNITKIRGVMRQIPIVGVAAGLSLLGLAGAPMFNASISKYFMMAQVGPGLNITLTIINLGTTIISIKLASILFGKADPAQLQEPQQNEENHDHDGHHGSSIHNKTGTNALEQAMVLLLGLLSLAGGIFGQQAVYYFFGSDISIDTAGYIEKAVIFFISLAAGYVLFRRTSQNPILNRIRTMDMGFRAMCTSIGVFFALVLLSVSTFGL